MSRTPGLDDVLRVADLIDHTVTLLTVTAPYTREERVILTGLAERLRIDVDVAREEPS